MSDNPEIQKLVNKLNKYREMYYNEGKSVISDEQFDFEERRLKEMDPNNEYFTQVGRSLNSSKDIKIEHEFPMLSMQKVQTADEAVKWFYDLSKINGLYFNDKLGLSVWIDPKLDGISGKIVYDKMGNFSFASSRGDGLVGARLDSAKYIESVPKKFLPECELRGEFIINKKYSKLYNSPLRNICSGIMKRQEYTDEINYVSFVIYDFHAYNPKYNIDFKDRGDKIKQISKILDDLDQVYNIVPVEKTNNIPEVYDRYVNKMRDEWEYETDGVILTVDGGQDNYDLINSKYVIKTFNRFNMALKPPAEYASSEITSIDTYVNRQKLSFVANIKPTFINGVIVSRATLDNYQNMIKFKIGIGSTVLVKRTNDVIPKIVKSYNEEGKYIKYIKPTVCPECGSKLFLYHQEIACPNEYGCKGIFSSKLKNMFTALETKNIGPSVIKGLVEFMKKENIHFTFYNTFKIFLSNDLDRFLNEFYGTEKRSVIFKTSIENILNNLYEIKFLHGFNIPFIGEGELIKHNIRSINDLFEYIKDLESKHYLDSFFDTTLFEWSRDENHMKDLKYSQELLKKYFKKETGIMENSITYCISGPVPGMKKEEVVKLLNELNSELVFVKDVNINLNFLISYESGTTKVMKARKYNIPIMTLEEVVKKFKK